MTRAADLPRSTPEAQGIPSSAIGAFIDAAERDLDALHSFMLLRHGRVVAEGWWDPYRPQDRHVLFSLSKSFTSTAIGLLVAEGRLSIDDPVLAFFPDDTPPEPSANLRAMRVRHLLTMTTGHALDTTNPMASEPGRTWVRGFLAQPVEHEPGTHFLYNSGATYMLSAIVQRLTGGRMLNYLGPRLFAPLGIADPIWQTSPQGIDTGGWGLSITTADIAAFGQLYLQRGLWDGTRLVSEAWIDAATAHQVANDPDPKVDWAQGYGYQFWRCRHGAYRGDGAFGQFCVVMPEQDAVLAITSGLPEMQPVLDLVWDHLLPAMGHAPLPDDTGARAALTGRLAHLQLRTPSGQARARMADRISGKPFALAENRAQLASLRFDFGTDEAVITLGADQGDQRIACGYGRWVRGTVGFGPQDDAERVSAPQHSGPWPIAASGAWTDDATYAVRLWWTETPFARTLTCRFADDRVTVEQRNNVGFGPIEGERLEGRLVP